MGNKRWIFQDIKDLQENVLYVGNYVRDRKVWDANWDNYVAALREKVTPEIYTLYQLWLCDIDVCITEICMNVRGLYPEVSREQIVKWLWENKEEHHYLYE